MIKSVDALKFMSDQARQSMLPVEIPTSDVRQKVVVLNGKIEYLEMPAPPRNHQVETIADFIAAVAKYGTGGVIWHSHKQMVLVTCDEGDRRDTVTMSLVESDRFVLLRNIAAKAFDQKSMVRLLKNDLNGCVADSLRTVLSNLEILSTSGMKSDINPGRERGTREFAVDVANSTEIPDSIVVNVPVYSNQGADETTGIKCAFDYTVPPETVTFNLRPLPDELRRAVQVQQNRLTTLLTDKCPGVPVFQGSP